MQEELQMIGLVLWLSGSIIVGWNARNLWASVGSGMIAYGTYLTNN